LEGERHAHLKHSDASAFCVEEQRRWCTLKERIDGHVHNFGYQTYQPLVEYLEAETARGFAPEGYRSVSSMQGELLSLALILADTVEQVDRIC